MIHIPFRPGYYRMRERMRAHDMAMSRRIAEWAPPPSPLPPENPAILWVRLLFCLVWGLLIAGSAAASGFIAWSGLSQGPGAIPGVIFAAIGFFGGGVVACAFLRDAWLAYRGRYW